MRQPFETVITALSVPLREGLARSLVATDFRVVASTPDEGDPAQMPLSGSQPILLIVNAGNEHDETLSQIKTFKKHYPSGCVAVIADHYRRGDLISAYRAGANAYFTKAMSCDAFLKTLELVMLGQTILPPELLPFIQDGAGRRERVRTPMNGADDLPPRKSETAAVLPGKPDAPRSLGTNSVPRLSAREKCILHCVIDGHSNKSIARKMDITEATVKVHVKAIFRKIHVNNRTQAAIWAIDNSSLIWSETEEGNAAIERPRTYPVNSVARINETPAYEGVANGKHACINGSAAPARKY